VVDDDDAMPSLLIPQFECLITVVVAFYTGAEY
jgi:hypothetical protein